MLADAAQTLGSAPERAERLCRLVLAQDGDNGDARLLLSEALRRRGALEEARALAEEEVRRRPSWFGASRQLGVVLADLREPLAASIAFQNASKLNPTHPTLWRDVADQLALAGDVSGSQAAYLQYAMNGGDPALRPAVDGLRLNRIDEAAALLRAFVAGKSTDVVALKLLSEAEARSGRADLAERDLRRALDLAPGFTPARHGLGQLLMGLGRLDEARAEARKILRDQPANIGARRLLAAIEYNANEFEAALRIYQDLLSERPQQPSIWMSRGHVLKAVGRVDECISAYRTAIEQQPDLGDAFWGLADLKTFRFDAAEVTHMERLLEQEGLAADARVSTHYALGKAYEDDGRAESAFLQYKTGAAVHRAQNPYDPGFLSAFVDASIALFTRDFLETRRSWGDPSRDPIFVVGLPRAGSTLVEQILSSHSLVEGTAELPDLNNIAQGLVSPEAAASGVMYLEALAAQTPESLARLGVSYLERTRGYRKTSAPIFINKMPNDFMHVGLIQMILPNAKVIDARRNPLACGWSCFKQHFARGQLFSYDLTHIGRFYTDYVRLMAHFDATAPGRVHRVLHEALVQDPEPHIRALLAYCGLPFEEACLRPHETQRAVRTASSQQVRQPISAKGLDSWRRFEPLLGELNAALGEIATAYPSVPMRFRETGGIE
jgi:tetratricopeptide (TPR) repeat protein